MTIAIERPALKAVIGHEMRDRIAFVGPFGVGKTTALNAISDIPVSNMDAHSTESEISTRDIGGKTTTTVGFDYGEWLFEDGSRVGLFGVPSQDRFDAIWDALLPNTSGVVLWLHGDDPHAVESCRYWLDILASRNAVARLAVAITRIPLETDPQALAPYREVVARYHPYAPVITADPRDRQQVMQAVTVALSTPFHFPASPP